MSSYRSFLSWLKDKIFNFFSAFFFALPIALGRDVLYLWASFRLRRRPIKTFFWVLMVGMLCWGGQYYGSKYGHPYLIRIIRDLPPTDLKQVLGNTAGAIFSSLNLLSCISIVIMFMTMRHLTDQAHLEMLILTPNRIRPSALFYAISTRYLPLTLAAMLIIYLNPQRTPFQEFPFKAISGIANANEQFDDELMRRPWVLYWAAIQQFSLFLFCPFNVFMDLSIAFWIFTRWRVSYMAMILAVVVVGILEPVAIMWCNLLIDRNTRFFDYMNPYTRRNIVETRHYLSVALASLFIAWNLLADLDARWARILRKGKKDPVLLRGGE